MIDKTIALSSVSFLLIIILGGVLLTDNNVFFCEDRNIVMSCEKLSGYYSLENGKCWNSNVGNKLCKSGWLKIKKDVIGNITEEHEGIIKEYKGRVWICESQDSNSVCMRNGTHKAFRFQLEE